MIFIGDDSRFPEVAQVLAYSIRKHCLNPPTINFLRLSELNFYRSYVDTHPPSTEFTYTRFLVPSLMSFEGKAIFMDNDMLCFGDINEIFNLDVSKYCLRVVKQSYVPLQSIKMYGTEQTFYKRKNWSSLMLLNCAKLRVWNKRYIESTRGLFLHQFKYIPDELIGDLPLEWNHIDLQENTKLLHYTEGGPWFERYRNCPNADLWLDHYEEWKNSESGAIWRSQFNPETV